MTTTHHKIFKSFLRPSPISFIFQPPCRPLCTHKNFRSNLSALPRKNRYTTQVEDIWTINSQDRAPAWLHEARTPVLIALTLWAAFSLMNWIRRSRHVDAEAGRQDPPGFVSPAERWAATYLGQAADQRGEEQVRGTGILVLNSMAWPSQGLDPYLHIACLRFFNETIVSTQPPPLQTA